MLIEFVKEYSARTTGGESRTVAAGTVLDLSPEKAAKLIDAGIALDLGVVISIWRGFVLSADKLYRASMKTTAAWKRHRSHHEAAQACFSEGRIQAAQVELEKALAALHDA